MKTKQVSIKEKIIGFIIIGILITIAVGVYLKQFKFNKALLNTTTLENQNISFNLNLSSYKPDGLNIMTPQEEFNKENLSNKIDGKAELYLPAGFKKLVTQRFYLKTNKNLWMEIYVYDMQSLRNAFSVYSLQKRLESADTNITQFSYKTQNGLYFVHGQFYLEIVSANINENINASMMKWAEKFVKGIVIRQENIIELEFFSDPQFIKSSIAFQKKDVFSCKDLNNIFTASFKTDNNEVTIFISVRKSAKEAKDLINAYHKFLIENGGTKNTLDSNIPELKTVNLFGDYEIIFNHKNIVAGIHGISDKNVAKELIQILYKKVKEFKDETN